MTTGHIEYCHSWNRRRMRVGVPLTPDDGRARHDSGEEYTAVLHRTGTRPVLVTVDGENRTIAVTFFDEHDRQNLKYWFREVDDGRMFLRDVTYWEYPDDRPGLRLNESSRIEQVQFHEDGYVRRTVIDKVEQVKDTHEYRDVPVEGNWEPAPAFGDYWSIARRERPGRRPGPAVSPAAP